MLTELPKRDGEGENKRRLAEGGKGRTEPPVGALVSAMLTEAKPSSRHQSESGAES